MVNILLTIYILMKLKNKIIVQTSVQERKKQHVLTTCTFYSVSLSSTRQPVRSRPDRWLEVTGWPAYTPDVTED